MNLVYRTSMSKLILASKTVNIHEAKTHLSRLLERVLTGEEIIIAKGGKPIARLTALPSAVPKRMPGTAKGRLILSRDFDQPLPDRVLRMFEK